MQSPTGVVLTDWSLCVFVEPADFEDSASPHALGCSLTSVHSDFLQSSKFPASIGFEGSQICRFSLCSHRRFLEERHFQVQLLYKRLIVDLGFSKSGFIVRTYCGSPLLFLWLWLHLLTPRCISILKRDLLQPPFKWHCVTAISLSYRRKINLKYVTENVPLTGQHVIYTIWLHNTHILLCEKFFASWLRMNISRLFKIVLWIIDS